MDLTLLEVHVSDAEFNAPFAGDSKPEDSQAREEPEAPEEPDVTAGQTSDGSVLVAVVVLLGFAALAWFLRRRLGGDSAEIDAD